MRRLCLFLFLLGLAVPGFGQSNYAVLTGTVTDSQNLPIAGATVELTAATPSYQSIEARVTVEK